MEINQAFSTISKNVMLCITPFFCNVFKLIGIEGHARGENPKYCAECSLD
jgi:hypothetical protein